MPHRPRPAPKKPTHTTQVVPSGPNRMPTPATSRTHHPFHHPTNEARTRTADRCRQPTHQCLRQRAPHHPNRQCRLLPRFHGKALLRKEVIQPHLPVRLPCYDFVPIASPTFDGSLPQGVGPPASGVADFRDVTGGVYKARERIHRSVADLRLLATPTSRGRVADPDPN
jgi:hypothetical protein